MQLILRQYVPVLPDFMVQWLVHSVLGLLILYKNIPSIHDTKLQTKLSVPVKIC